jgi:hypothetical protein
MARTLVMLHPRQQLQHIEIGFCWPASLLGPLWALANRLWLIGLLLLSALIQISIVAQAAVEYRDEALSALTMALTLAYLYLCGRYGNAMRRWTLERRGYQLIRGHHVL